MVDTRKIVAREGEKAKISSATISLQLRVLGRGLLQDGNVWVGVFPEGEEVFVSRKRTNAAHSFCPPSFNALKCYSL